MNDRLSGRGSSTNEGCGHTDSVGWTLFVPLRLAVDPSPVLDQSRGDDGKERWLMADLTLERLARLTDVIGELFGRRNECIEACALFVAAAERLGLSVRPRAVSILAMTAGGHCAVAGREGALQAREAGLDVPDDAPVLETDETQFDHAGHMIVSCNSPALLCDPTFRQFSPGGLPDIVIVGTVQSAEPARGWITIPFPQGRPEGDVTYFFDPANSGWQVGFEYAKDKWAEGEVAAAVADHVAAGRWGDTLSFAIPWDEQPPH